MEDMPKQLVRLTEKKEIEYSMADVIKLDTKCLYAGKLERIKMWHEKPHKHPFCEIMFVLAGRGQAIIDGVPCQIKKGDLVIYNPDTLHEEFTVDDQGLELAFFGITNFQIGHMPIDHLTDRGASPIIHTKKEEEQFRFYFTSLVAEVYNERAYSELIAKYWARLILIGILRLSDISQAKFVTNAVFNRIHQHLSQNFARIDSMEQICDELKVSKYYLSHVFRNYMGMPPMQYITSRRIAYAKKLLQETNLSASAIGEECGYKDQVLFFKAFKRLEGMTPLAYRRQTQKHP